MKHKYTEWLDSKLMLGAGCFSLTDRKGLKNAFTYKISQN